MGRGGSSEVEHLLGMHKYPCSVPDICHSKEPGADGSKDLRLRPWKAVPGESNDNGLTQCKASSCG